MGRVPLGKISAEPPILAAWSAIGLGAALSDGIYYTPSIILVSLGTLVLVAVTVFPTGPSQQSRQQLDWGLPIGSVVFTAVALPAGLYASGFELYLSHTLTALAALVLALLFIFQQRVPRLVAYLLIGLMAWAGVAIVLASPTPYIDVWYLLQAATHGLSHGYNMYQLQWFAPPGEDSSAFVYLPGCAVLLWPFYLVFGDVRYGELAALLLTGVILMRARGGRTGSLVGCLAVMYPAALFSIERAWIDPLLVLELCAAGYLCTRGHKRVAMLAFAAALVTKQEAWLLVPLAVVWEEFGWRRTGLAVAGAIAFLLPWYLYAPAGFLNGVLLYNLRLPARLDSLSLFTTAILHGWHPIFGLTGIATLAALTLALWRGARDTHAFFVGSAMVLAIFNLTNKQSFFNEWELVAGLALAAIAFARSNAVDVPPSSVGSSRSSC